MITGSFFLLYRAASTQSVDNFPSASEIKQEKEEIIPCHICERNNNKEETTAADMYCYNCDNVFCDKHSGESKTFFDTVFGNPIILGKMFGV